MSSVTVKEIRDHEFDMVIELFGEYINSKDVLEIGSGKGDYLRKFKKVAKSANGVDLDNGSCSIEKIDGVTYYDGFVLPFEDESFDVVFSSSVLEHIPHLNELESEFQRVLRPTGVAIHIVPNANWRIYTVLLHYIALPYQLALFVLRRLSFLKKMNVKVQGSESPQVVKHTPLSLFFDFCFARRHGESGNRFTEVFYFMEKFWNRHFSDAGWLNIEKKCSGIFYCNYSTGLGLNSHVKLSKLLGSATTIYKMDKMPK